MDGEAHQLSPLGEQAIRSENVPPCSINAYTGILVNESYQQTDLMRKVSVPYCNPALPCGGRRVFIIAVSQGFSLARSFRPNFPASVWREIWQPVVFITLIGTNLSRCWTKMKWELKIDSGLMSAGCTAPKSASGLIDMTPVYTLPLSISPTDTQSTDLCHLKCLPQQTKPTKRIYWPFCNFCDWYRWRKNSKQL